jgi:hypothetical protein
MINGNQEQFYRFQLHLVMPDYQQQMVWRLSTLMGTSKTSAQHARRCYFILRRSRVSLFYAYKQMSLVCGLYYVLMMLPDKQNQLLPHRVSTRSLEEQRVSTTYPGISTAHWGHY